jgi:hypothetical protein
MWRRRMSVLLAVSVLGSLGASAPLPSVAAPVTALPARAEPRSTGLYRSVPATRIADSRQSFGLRPVPARGTRNLQVVGRSSPEIPGTATAVVLTVTVVAQASGVLTIYPAGEPRPTTSNHNFVAGRPVAKQVVVSGGTDGKLTIYNSSSAPAEVIVDLQGFFEPGPPVPGATVLVSPRRLMDTRTGLGGATPKANATVDLQVTGRGGVPADGVAAALVNVTAAYPQQSGHLAAFPTGESRYQTPLPGLDSSRASLLNFAPRTAVPNFAVAKLGRGGKITIRNASRGSTPVVVDVVGYVLAGTPALRGAYAAFSPRRIADTRPSAPLGPRDVRQLDLTDPSYGYLGIPTDAEAYALTVTAVGSTAASYLTVGSPRFPPTTSNVMHRPGLVPAGSVLAEAISIYNHAGTVHAVTDLSGYFLGRDGASGVGVLTGRVTGEGVGGLAGVFVSAFPADQLGSDDPWGITVLTDAQGRFRVDNLRPDSYALCAESPMNSPYRYECYQDVPWNAERPPRESTLLAVNPGSTTAANWELGRR